jgi:HTH-type transcriptional regulator/antitoxin MqsA
MTKLASCPICGEGSLTPFISSHAVTYKGVEKSIKTHFTKCNVCETEQAGSRELMLNKRAMNEFKKEVEGLLSGSEIKAIRDKLGLTQDQASRVFGGGPKAFSKYETNDIIQSEAMDKLMRVAIAERAAYIFLYYYSINKNYKKQNIERNYFSKNDVIYDNDPVVFLTPLKKMTVNRVASFETIGIDHEL